MTTGDPRPPVFILVCKNTKIAKVIYRMAWRGQAARGHPAREDRGLPQQRMARSYTIRVDTKVVHETDTGDAKSDENAWMRLTLDTVGKTDWPRDPQGRPIYPEGFEELAKKLERPLHPPGRDMRCIVSVGMLTEGWDCNTVTHIIGLRPFMSQLAVRAGGRPRAAASELRGRRGWQVDRGSREGIRRAVRGHAVQGEQGRLRAPQSVKRHHVHALPEKDAFEIQVSRAWKDIAGDPQPTSAMDWRRSRRSDSTRSRFRPKCEVKGMLPTQQGAKPSLSGPAHSKK